MCKPYQSINILRGMVEQGGVCGLYKIGSIFTAIKTSNKSNIIPI